MQCDDSRDVLKIEDVHRFAADLAEYNVARADLSDGGHHAALPAFDDLCRFLLVIETMRARPGLAAPAQAAASPDIDVQQYRRTHETECGQREPKRDHWS